MTLNRPKLFNPEYENKPTSLVNGKSSGVLNWNDILYQQFFTYYKSLLGNFWTPFEIDMSSDSLQYMTELSEGERDTFRKIIGLLAILDSVQPKFLSLIQMYLSDDSAKDCMIIVGQQEVVHNHSYSYVLSSVENLTNQNLAFNIARTDEDVYKRNELVLDLYEKAIDEPNIDNFIKALIASVVLEGINFYSAFAFFYDLARHQKMVGTSTMISYINRDELAHTVLIAQIIKIILKEEEGNFTIDVEEFAQGLFKQAVELETVWSKKVLADVEDIDLYEMEDYIKYRANKCLSMIGFAPIYEGVDENSMKWIKAYTNEGDTLGLTKTDFFEQRPREYAKVDDDNGFDDL